MKKISMLGTGLIGTFYTMALHGQRSKDRVVNAYSRTKKRAEEFAAKWDIPAWTDNMDEAISDPESDVVIVALPNNLHKEAILQSSIWGAIALK